jgi:hypothetical protein
MLNKKEKRRTRGGRERKVRKKERKTRTEWRASSHMRMGKKRYL